MEGWAARRGVAPRRPRDSKAPSAGRRWCSWVEAEGGGERGELGMGEGVGAGGGGGVADAGAEEEGEGVARGGDEDGAVAGGREGGGAGGVGERAAGGAGEGELGGGADVEGLVGGVLALDDGAEGGVVLGAAGVEDAEG